MSDREVSLESASARLPTRRCMPRVFPSSVPRFALLIGAMLLAGGCRPGAVGPPEPDAEAIISGLAGPDVRVDSVDAPFQVELERGRWRTRDGKRTHRDFWSEVAHLDMVNADAAATSMEERTFAAALKRLMASDPDAAAVAFGALHQSATDPLVRTRSRVGLTMALTWDSDWEGIAGMVANVDTSDVEDPRIAQAGVERWAKAFSGLPSMTVSIPATPVTLPLRRSAFGTPVVTVEVNGKPHEFWLDTGASMTLVSSDVAIGAGIRLAAPDTLALGVVTGHIDARAVYIDSISLGGFMARGLPAAVVNPSVLRLDRRVESGVMRAVPIDGVIGADLIRHMDLVIDAAAGTLTISRPKRQSSTVRNLFWVGYPVVRFIARDGQALLFGLDTGAEASYVTSGLLHRLPHTPIAARRSSIGGLGTGRTTTDWVVRDIRMSDGDYAVVLRNAPIAPDRRWTFVSFDGIIGSDVALATRLHLDFTNGVFDIRPSAVTEPMVIRIGGRDQ